MIFVTVGTTMPFDELLEEVDRLFDEGLLEGELLTQTGTSKYRMRHGEQFAARKSIDDEIARSRFVISHGGATVVNLVSLRKNFVAFPNPRAAGQHQELFLRELAAIADISWSTDVRNLKGLYRHRLAVGPPTVRSEVPRAADVIRAFIARA
jgi:UDP-N-acetylglucosamine transferase subunit ALG13